MQPIPHPCVRFEKPSRPSPLSPIDIDIPTASTSRSSLDDRVRYSRLLLNTSPSISISGNKHPSTDTPLLFPHPCEGNSDLGAPCVLLTAVEEAGRWRMEIIARRTLRVCRSVVVCLWPCLVLVLVVGRGVGVGVGVGGGNAALSRVFVFTVYSAVVVAAAGVRQLMVGLCASIRSFSRSGRGGGRGSRHVWFDQWI